MERRKYPGVARTPHGHRCRIAGGLRPFPGGMPFGTGIHRLGCPDRALVSHGVRPAERQPLDSTPSMLASSADGNGRPQDGPRATSVPRCSPWFWGGNGRLLAPVCVLHHGEHRVYGSLWAPRPPSLPWGSEASRRVQCSRRSLLVPCASSLPLGPEIQGLPLRGPSAAAHEGRCQGHDASRQLLRPDGGAAAPELDPIEASLPRQRKQEASACLRGGSLFPVAPW